MIYTTNELKKTGCQSEQTKTSSKPTFHEKKRLSHFIEHNICHQIRTQLMLNSGNSPEDLELYDQGVAFGYLARYHGLKEYLKSIGISSVSIKDTFEISWFFPDSIRIHLMSLYIYSKDIPLERPSRKQLKNKSFQEGYIWALKSLPKIYNEWSRIKGLTDIIFITENVLFLLENLDYPFLNDPIFQEFISNVKGKIVENSGNQLGKIDTQDANKQKLLTFIKNNIPQPEENVDTNYNELFKEGYAYGYIHCFEYVLSNAKINNFNYNLLDIIWIFDKEVSKLLSMENDPHRVDLRIIMCIPTKNQLDSSAFLKGYMKAMLELPIIFQEWFNILKADTKIQLNPNVVISYTMWSSPCSEDNNFQRFISVLRKILPSKCNCLSRSPSYRLHDTVKEIGGGIKKIKGYDHYANTSKKFTFNFKFLAAGDKNSKGYKYYKEVYEALLKDGELPSEKLNKVDLTLTLYT